MSTENAEAKIDEEASKAELDEDSARVKNLNADAAKDVLQADDAKISEVSATEAEAKPSLEAVPYTGTIAGDGATEVVAKLTSPMPVEEDAKDTEKTVDAPTEDIANGETKLSEIAAIAAACEGGKNSPNCQPTNRRQKNTRNQRRRHGFTQTHKRTAHQTQLQPQVISTAAK